MCRFLCCAAAMLLASGPAFTSEPSSGRPAVSSKTSPACDCGALCPPGCRCGCQGAVVYQDKAVPAQGCLDAASLSQGWRLLTDDEAVHLPTGWHYRFGTEQCFYPLSQPLPITWRAAQDWRARLPVYHGCAGGTCGR